VQNYSNKVDFLTVYIQEAHPADGWALKSNSTSDVCYRQPKTLKSRLQIAKIFVEKENYEKVPFAVDDITNEAATEYKSLPERLYIIEDGKISFRGGRGPNGYRLFEVIGWVVDYCESESEI